MQSRMGIVVVEQLAWTVLEASDLANPPTELVDRRRLVQGDNNLERAAHSL